MRAHQHAAPLVVVRSEAESGRVGLRLIGELDLNTVGLLEAELSRTREQSPPSVIDLSELRFLDLVGLRALLRCVKSDVAGTARLVGATGIVRRLIDLAHTLDQEESPDPAHAPFPAEPSTRVAAGYRDAVPATAIHAASENAAGIGAAVASSSPEGQPQ
jgi:anti-anti-sigma factor